MSGPVRKLRLFFAGRIDHARDVPAGADDEAAIAGQGLRRGEAALPGDDVVLAGAQDVGRDVDAAQVDAATPSDVSRPGIRNSFCRYVCRRYQQNIGPGRLVLSAFQ